MLNLPATLSLVSHRWSCCRAVLNSVSTNTIGLFFFETFYLGEGCTTTVPFIFGELGLLYLNGFGCVILDLVFRAVRLVVPPTAVEWAERASDPIYEVLPPPVVVFLPFYEINRSILNLLIKH